MSEHRKADYDYQTTVATVFSVARRAKTIFDNSSEVAGKRTFLNYLLQNPTLKGKEIDFTFKKPFDLILNLANLKSKTASISTSRLTWLQLVDEFRTLDWKNIQLELDLMQPSFV